MYCYCLLRNIEVVDWQNLAWIWWPYLKSNSFFVLWNISDSILFDFGQKIAYYKDTLQYPNCCIIFSFQIAKSINIFCLLIFGQFLYNNYKFLLTNFSRLLYIFPPHFNMLLKCIYMLRQSIQNQSFPQGVPRTPRGPWSISRGSTEGSWWLRNEKRGPQDTWAWEPLT